MTFLSSWIASISLFITSLFIQVPSTPPIIVPSATPVMHQAGIPPQHVSSTSSSSEVTSFSPSTTTPETSTLKNFPYTPLSPKVSRMVSEQKSKYYITGHTIYVASSTKSGVLYLVVPVSNPEKFIAISQWYGTDEQNVYYIDKIIMGADPATFYVKNTGCGWMGVDAHHNYVGGRINVYNPTSTPDANLTSKAGKEVLPISQGDC